MSSDTKSVFQGKYDEFCAELALTFPELSVAIGAAKALAPEQRLERYAAEVLPHASPSRDVRICPVALLPGVTLTPALWAELSTKTQDVIQEFLSLLSICYLLESGKGSEGFPGLDSKETGAWMDGFMKSMKDKMSSVDFEGIASKMAGLFGMDGSKIPQLPEKFLKGHLARLAEEIMRDFKPEDLGLDAETIKKCEANPSSAFELLMKMYTTNPAFISNTVQKIGKRLQAKIQSGSIRPTEIVAEAEELMKIFSENPAFKDLMGSFSSMFNMDELTKAPGAVGVSARRSIVSERLRKELERRKAKAAGIDVSATTGGGAGGAGGGGSNSKKPNKKKGGK
jgi:hypothetical protein